MTGGGEMRTTGAVNASLLAPTFLSAGVELPDEGAVSGPLIWWRGCGVMLDCEQCPPTVVPGFNASTLRGAILVLYLWEDEKIYQCGGNRIARGLAEHGPAALAMFS